MKSTFFLAIVIMAITVARLHGEDRTIDGTGNHLVNPARGAAQTPMIRHGYRALFSDASGAMITDPLRPNARDVSNAVFAQSASIKSARGLSDYAWAWGQFLAHDMDLTTTSDGVEINGSAPIAIHDLLDPLGPNPIPFTRANFTDVAPILRGSLSGRTPINEVTSYIDASNVYGSDSERAAALRTEGGTGARLRTSEGNLLPYNTAGLPNENNGPISHDRLFLAGDIRANENSLLTSLHTIFAREHNRLVDIIADKRPALDAEEQYQLARKLVGAELQIITYNEFLPALLGDGPSVPKAEGYLYSPNMDASITNAFAHATYRFGHSAVSSELRLAEADGASAGGVALRNAFFNPTAITENPTLVDQFLAGAALQRSEEIDTFVVDDLRNFLFGPPGAGGLDLAAINIERGRDVGLPSYRELRSSHQLPAVQSLSQITSDPDLIAALTSVYGQDLNNIDAWVGALAESHAPGASVGPLIKTMLENQFRRLRDGDRLFHRADAAGLYTDGTLNPEIAEIIDLDNVRLADILLANTSIEILQRNVFFAPGAGDFNGDGTVDAADYTLWRNSRGSTTNLVADADSNGVVDDADYGVWKLAYGNVYAITGAERGGLAAVPEPTTFAGVTMVILLLALTRCRHRLPGSE